MRRIAILAVIGIFARGFVFAHSTGVPRMEKRAQPNMSKAAMFPAAGLKEARLRSAVHGVPLAFEANRGQFDPAVQYRARGQGYQLLLERDGLHFETHAAKPMKTTPKHAAKHSAARDAGADSIHLRLAGAPANLNWRGRDGLSATANYFIGNDRSHWRTGVPLYAAAGAMEMAPGVDCLVYAGSNGPEMDFDVARGTDLRRVRLEVAGARQLKMDPAGDLLIEGRAAIVRLRHPAIYQMVGEQHRSIAGGYAIVSSRSVGFRVADYDHSLPLVIDPSVAVTYTTFLGGSGADSANGLAMDASGAVYISGTTANATSFTETVTKKFGSGGGSNDFFVAKIDPTQSGAASLKYLSFVGGSGDEEGGKLSVNSNGQVAIVGTTTSTDYPTTDSTKLTKGSNDLALTLLDPTGSSLVFSTVLDGTGAFAIPLDAANDHGTPAVAFAPNGTVIVTADTTAADLPVTAGAFQPAYGGAAQTTTPPLTQSDGMLAVYSVPSLTYLTYFGINGFTNDEQNFVPALVGVTGVAVDLLGQAYVTGFTSQPGTGFLTTNGFQTAYAGGAFDAFLLCLKPKGLGSSDLVYSTFLGGSASDQAFAVAVDQAIPANAYVVGTTQSADATSNSPPQLEGFQTSLQGNANGFLAAVAQTQAGATTLSYATYLGGSSSDSVLGVVSLGADAVYLTGHAKSLDFPTLNTLQSFSGTGDAFIAKLDTTTAGAASLLYASLFGGGNDAQGNGVAALPTGEIVIAGSTTSHDFPLGGNTQTGMQPICASCQESPAQADAFVVALAESEAGGPEISFNPPALNFQNVAVGSTNTPQIVRVTNSGGLTVSINGINTVGANLGDFPLSNDCPIAPTSLPPQAFCTITANFNPSVAGQETAQVVVSDNAFASPQTLDLVGVGVEPLASLSTTALNFGNQPAQTVSNSQTLIITNGGNLQLAISLVNITGPDVAQFRFTDSNTCVNPPIVQPGASCIMNVAFAPQTQGNFSASLLLVDNSGNNISSTQTVVLTGTGTPPAPAAHVSPTALNFGSQSTGTTSGPQTVSLTNTGNLALLVSSVALSGTNSSEFKIASATNCPMTGGSVNAGANCAVNIAFAPASTGPKSASLTFVDNVAGSPQIVALTGTATSSPAVTITPPNIGFQGQTLKMPSQGSIVTVTNSGTAIVQLSSISVTGPNSSDFIQTNNCPSPGTLNPSAACQVSVVFQPQSGGARTASLSFTDSATGSPQAVTLSGTGLVPAVSLSAAAVNFATQLAGTTSAAATVTITNSGNGGLVISSLGLGGANPTEFSATQNCGDMLAAGASCGVSVVFQPQPGQAGSAAATLSINDNALDSPEAIAITGSVDDFSLGASTSGSLSAVVTGGNTAPSNSVARAKASAAGQLESIRRADLRQI